MEQLARAFEMPVDSPEHRDLAENGWIAGSAVTVRYWLGRLLHRNYFRESDEAVLAALQQFFVDRGCSTGAIIFRERQAWSAAATLLRHYAAGSRGCGAAENPRLVKALEAVVYNPDLTDAQLAAIANTTRKQIARMREVFLIRKLWRLCQEEG